MIRLIILCTSFLLFATNLLLIVLKDDNDAHLTQRKLRVRRRLQSLPDCSAINRPPPQLPSIPNLLDKSATYAVSFPGLADKLVTHHLIENITGMLVGEASTSPSLERMKAQHMDHSGFARGQGEAIAVRTNYPHITGTLSAYDYDIHRAIIILHNPITAIPNYFDHLYELNSHVPAGDTSEETINAFVKWRDNQFNDQLELWKQMVNVWLEKYENEEQRIFISYESLVSTQSGLEVMKLAEFLANGMKASAMEVMPNNVTAVEDAVSSFANTDEMFCIWKDMVKSIGGSSSSTTTELTTNPYRPLTTENLVDMSQILLGLVDRWKESYPQVAEILMAYCTVVLNEYQKQLTQIQPGIS